jgi:hypothetical protein
MTSAYRCLTLAVVVFSLASFSGCNPGPTLVQVQGKILVDGKPANGAVLLFHPDGGTAKSVSSAQALEDGTFTLVTDTKPGILAGNYIVTLTWPDPSHKVSDRDKMMGLAEPGKDLLDGKYVMKDRSGIKVEIAAGATTLPPIEVKSK